MISKHDVERSTSRQLFETFYSLLSFSAAKRKRQIPSRYLSGLVRMKENPSQNLADPAFWLFR